MELFRWSKRLFWAFLRQSLKTKGPSFGSFWGDCGPFCIVLVSLGHQFRIIVGSVWCCFDHILRSNLPIFGHFQVLLQSFCSLFGGVLVAKGKNELKMQGHEKQCIISVRKGTWHRVYTGIETLFRLKSSQIDISTYDSVQWVGLLGSILSRF